MHALELCTPPSPHHSLPYTLLGCARVLLGGAAPDDSGDSNGGVVDTTQTAILAGN